MRANNVRGPKLSEKLTPVEPAVGCQGNVISFNGETNTGRIEYDSGVVFVHRRQCRNGPPTLGQLVTFDITIDEQGRARADNVQELNRASTALKPAVGCQGKVISFNEEKNMGRIEYASGVVFFHGRQFLFGAPTEGQ